MAFVPPLYNNLGKNVKDLFKKKYDYDSTLKVVNKSTQGLNLETSVVSTKTNGLRGSVTSTYNCQKCGTFETKLQSDAAQESSVSLKFKPFFKGFNSKLTFQTRDSKDKAFKQGLAIADVDYATEYVAAAAQLKSDLEVSKGEASLVAGSDGLSVGANVQFDLSAGAQLTDFNAGVEWAKQDLTTTLQTEKQRSVVSASFYQKISDSQVVGATFKTELTGKQARSLTFGSDLRLDSTTTFRAKTELSSVDTSSFLFSGALEHRLAKPNAQLGLAASYRIGKAVEPVDFGATITLGDF